MEAGRPIRILLADDHELFSQALLALPFELHGYERATVFGPRLLPVSWKVTSQRIPVSPVGSFRS